MKMMKDHYGSDDELQRSRKGLAHLRAAILCVMCQTWPTAGEQGAGQRGGGGGDMRPFQLLFSL